MADAKELKDFTAREMEIMAKAWNCFVEEPKVNYEKLAAECGMTNVRSASNAWAVIKKKTMARGAGTGAATGGTKSNGTSEDDSATPTKATPKKRGKKASLEEGDEVEASPKKKVKTPKKSKAKADEGEGEEAKEVAVKGEDEEMDGEI